MSRPEHTAPADEFYDVAEASKYAQNSRMLKIQKQMSDRALELLALPEGAPLLLLDIGCGSAMSGDVLTAAGHHFIGMDISAAMLDVAVERESAGELLCMDMGHGIPFRPGTLDGAISISAVQWLCNADRSEHIPERRLFIFFSTLYRALARGARAVLQFYPENQAQMTLITRSAMKAGFAGGVVVDYPNSAKAKKYYLCLYTGPPSQFSVPSAKGAVDDLEGLRGSSSVEERPHGIRVGKRAKGQGKKPRRGERPQAGVKSRAWVLAKKERRRAQGKKTMGDSKYTARKRKTKF